MKINNITIVGLGAIGTVYATALSDAGISFTIAADASRCERYSREAFYFNDKLYNFRYSTPKVGDSLSDLIIIATKANGLDSALDLIAPLVGPHTTILPLLNGITSEEICGKRYGIDRVLYGYYIGHTASRIDNRVYQDGQYRTYFGEAENTTLSERVLAIQQLFDLASIPHKTPQDMLCSLWQKFIINVGLNQATAVLQRPYGHIQTNERAMALTINLMQEAAVVGTAEGIPDTDSMVTKGVSLLSTLTPKDGSSMYQDVIGGRETEVSIFADVVCSLGSKHNIPTPFNYYISEVIKSL